MTSLPFVFAVWACRADHPARDGLRRAVLAAREAGLGALDELAELHASRLGMDEARCREYLGRVLSYHVGPREREGMELFRRLRAEDALAESAGSAVAVAPSE